MSTQDNKEVVQKLHEALNKRNMEALKDFISEEYVGLSKKKGYVAFQEPLIPLFNAFPDIQWTVTEMIAEGDKVFVSWNWAGTHTGVFNGIAVKDIQATGAKVTNDGMAIYLFKDGKIISTKVMTDRLGFLQALQVLPTDLNKRFSKDKINFIDKFLIPAAAIKEFRDRTKINRDFIRTLPGFVGDYAYEYTDTSGNLIYITIAGWETQEAITKAKEMVQAEYKRQGFNPEEMMKRLHIVLDRGIYKEL